MPAPYVPEAGDVVWISFDPQHGHERAGHRPAVVLSKARYNDRASKKKGRITTAELGEIRARLVALIG